LQSFTRKQSGSGAYCIFIATWTAVPSGKVKEVAARLKAIHAQEDAKAAKEKDRQ
jgi:hypothetical protein